jgi:hypothetical protein
MRERLPTRGFSVMGLVSPERRALMPLLRERLSKNVSPLWQFRGIR